MTTKYHMIDLLEKVNYNLSDIYLISLFPKAALINCKIILKNLAIAFSASS